MENITIKIFRHPPTDFLVYLREINVSHLMVKFQHECYEIILSIMLCKSKVSFISKK